MPRRASTEQDYIDRIDRVIDHVQDAFHEKLRLDSLARIARFSPHHFHRVFRAHTGETLRAYVEHVRLSRAAFLIGRGGTQANLLEIAVACGLGSAPALSRAFKARYGVTPRAFREGAQTSKIRQEAQPLRPYLGAHARSEPHAPRTLHFVRRPARQLAYVRVQNPFAGARLVQARGRLLALEASRSLVVRERLGLSIDDPELTPPARCRYDLAIVTDARVRAPGISTRTLAGGLFAEVAVRGSAHDVADAWDGLFRALPASGYEPGTGPAMERYLAEADLRAFTGFDLELSLPVVRARRRR